MSSHPSMPPLILHALLESTLQCIVITEPSVGMVLSATSNCCLVSLLSVGPVEGLPASTRLTLRCTLNSTNVTLTYPSLQTIECSLGHQLYTNPAACIDYLSILCNNFCEMPRTFVIDFHDIVDFEANPGWNDRTAGLGSTWLATHSLPWYVLGGREWCGSGGLCCRGPVDGMVVRG